MKENEKYYLYLEGFYICVVVFHPLSEKKSIEENGSLFILYNPIYYYYIIYYIIHYFYLTIL